MNLSDSYAFIIFRMRAYLGLFQNEVFWLSFFKNMFIRFKCVSYNNWNSEFIIPAGQFVLQPAVSPTAIKQHKNIKQHKQ